MMITKIENPITFETFYVESEGPITQCWQLWYGEKHPELKTMCRMFEHANAQPAAGAL